MTFDEPVNVALAIWAALLVAHVVAASVYYWREQRSPEWLAALAIVAYWPILVLITCLGLAFKHLIRPLIRLIKQFRRRSEAAHE
uniref:Transmembrane protein n=1 Tax=Bradyrhizobium septentrionale TaxID=1404411 RepID=A0A974A1N1_9BRAD